MGVLLVPVMPVAAGYGPRSWRTPRSTSPDLAAAAQLTRIVMAVAAFLAPHCPARDYHV